MTRESVLREEERRIGVLELRHSGDHGRADCPPLCKHLLNVLVAEPKPPAGVAKGADRGE